MSAGGLLSLKWNNHCSTFLHILSNLHKKQTYHDATVACGGLLYPVHKMVLSTCSEYFEEMFDSIHDKHPIIVLKDIKGEVFEALLKYMYIGEVNVIQDRLSDLISAAECLKIKGLAVPDEEPSDNKSSRHSRSSSSSAAKRRHEQMSDSGATSLPPSKVQRSNSNNSYNNRNVNNVQSYASSNVMSRSQPVVDKSKPAECSREARDGSSYRSRKHSDDDIEEIQPEIKQEPRDVSAGEEEDMADDGTEQQTMRDGSSSHDNNERKHLSHQDRGEPGRTEKSARNMSGGEEEELSKQEMVEEEDESNVSEHWGGNDGDEEGDTFGFLGGDSNSGAGGTDGDTTHHHQQDNEEDDNNDGVPENNLNFLMNSAPSSQSYLPDDSASHSALPKIRRGRNSTSTMRQELESNAQNYPSDEHQYPGVDPSALQEHSSTYQSFSEMFTGPFSDSPKELERADPSLFFSPQYYPSAQRKRPSVPSSERGLDKSQHVCPHCNYRALSRSKLVVHLRSHSGEKPFACHVCSYRSINRGNLTAHLRTHAGEEPYQCQYCSYKAKYRKEFLEHLSTEHCTNVSPRINIS